MKSLCQCPLNIFFNSIAAYIAEKSFNNDGNSIGNDDATESLSELKPVSSVCEVPWAKRKIYKTFDSFLIESRNIITIVSDS